MERDLTRKLAYTVEEAAELLSVSRAHLYRLIDLQEIGSVTIGRSRRITAKQLATFLESLEIQATTAPRSAWEYSQQTRRSGSRPRNSIGSH